VSKPSSPIRADGWFGHLESGNVEHRALPSAATPVRWASHGRRHPRVRRACRPSLDRRVAFSTAAWLESDCQAKCTRSSPLPPIAPGSTMRRSRPNADALLERRAQAEADADAGHAARCGHADNRDLKFYPTPVRKRPTGRHAPARQIQVGTEIRGIDSNEPHALVVAPTHLVAMPRRLSHRRCECSPRSERIRVHCRVNIGPQLTSFRRAWHEIQSVTMVNRSVYVGRPASAAPRFLAAIEFLAIRVRSCG